MFLVQMPQSPLLKTEAYDKYDMDEYPLGTNACVAVISYTGEFYSYLIHLPCTASIACVKDFPRRCFQLTSSKPPEVVVSFDFRIKIAKNSSSERP